MSKFKLIKNLRFDFKNTERRHDAKRWAVQNIKGIVVGLVIFISAVAVLFGALDILSEASSVMVSQGSISAKDVSINTKIPGRILTVLVAEGQSVKAGDPLVEISSEEIEAKKLQLVALVEQAQAGVDASTAVLEMAQGNYEIAQERILQAEAGLNASRSQRDMASAMNDKAVNGARTQQVAQAESGFLLWASTYERAVALYDGGAISLQKLEEIKTQRDVAAQSLDMAKEGARTEDKAAAQAQLALADAGVMASQSVLNQAIEASNIALSQVNQAQAGLVASQGKLDQANAALMEVEVYLKDTVILSPIDGVVTALNSDEGELVSTGTSIGTVSNLENCWVSFNLDEDKLEGLKEGQTVAVNLPAYKDKAFKGTVASINKQADFAVKKATNENGNLDIISFGVRIEIDNSELLLRPGMTAIIDFQRGIQ